MTTADIQSVSETGEKCYALLAEAMKEYAIFLINKDYIDTWNQGAEFLFGYSAHEIIGKPVSLLFSSGQGGYSKISQLARKETKKWIEKENWVLRKDGTHVWAKILTHAVYELGTNEPHSFIQIIFKLSDREISYSYKELAGITYALNVSTIVAITNSQGIITYVNEAFEKISKYSKIELIGNTHKLINSSYHPKTFFQNMWKTISSGKIWKGEIRNRAKDGSCYWVDTTIVPLIDPVNGKAHHYVAVRHDITSRKQITQELQDSIQEINDIRYALDQSTIMAITDIQGNITYVNDAFCRISQYSREELLGKNHRILNSNHHSPAFFIKMWKTIAQGYVWKGEIKNRAKDGSYYWVDTTIVPQKDPITSKPRQYIAIRHDITSQKMAEEEIRALNIALETRVNERTEQLQNINKELEAFSYSVSHDLRTPLRSIDGFSNLLLQTKSEQLDDEGKEYLGLVKTSAQHMSELINDLLNLSKLSRSEMRKERLNLSEMAKEIFASLQKQEPYRSIEFFADENLYSYGDNHLIRAMMQNLIENAWKFTSNTKEAIIKFGSEQKHGKEVYYVQDNGVGFDMAYAGKLFGAFQRLHDAEEFPGTGVGLAIVYRIVHRHGGTIWAESEINKGATFYFTIT